MICTICGKTLPKDHLNNWTWAVLPGRAVAVPVCVDDRLCEVVCHKPKAVPKFKELARRFAQ